MYNCDISLGTSVASGIIEAVSIQSWWTYVDNKSRRATESYSRKYKFNL